jgi:anti-sigma B factor antagonist
MTMSYEVSKAGDVAELRLVGRIDRDALSSLDEAYHSLSSLAPERIVLDFSGVEYINSTGIALIVGILGRARADGRNLQASGLTPHYREIFEITRLSDYIEILQHT